MSRTITTLENLKAKNTNYWGNRIILQMEYTSKLSEFRNGKYDGLVDSVIDFIAGKYHSDGAITRETVCTAENMLLPASEEAKSLRMIYAAHAHIDMNWQWRYDETVQVVLDTFRTMLDIMNEYPDFKFSQSQAAVYRIVEEYDEEMLDEIRQRVKEGRWEVTASTWVEGDRNMPNGESLARQILYTKRYLSELLDIAPETLDIDFEPDTFGHSKNVPELLAKSGVKRFYHCRGLNKYNLYRWRAPSGNMVTAYRDPFKYSANINMPTSVHLPEFLYVPEFCSRYGMKDMLKLYGVGDHGGGPTRYDIERIIDMNSWPAFPRMTFGTFREFFDLVDKIADTLPVLEDELNFIYSGCYTSQSRIKMANRKGEAKLNVSETFNSIVALYTGCKYKSAHFADAWKKLLFNQFHDILPGPGKIDTREYALGSFQQTHAIANSQTSLALRKITALIDTSSIKTEQIEKGEYFRDCGGAGFGVEEFKISQCEKGRGKKRIFHFFNSSSCDREELTELIIWDWDGELKRMMFKDTDGNETRHQITQSTAVQIFGHKFIKLLVKVSVPAYGYNTYVMSEREYDRVPAGWPSDPRVDSLDGYVMENDYVRIEFDSLNGSILSFTDKSTGEEIIDTAKPAGIFRYVEEDDKKGMTAWNMGQYMKVINLNKNVKISKNLGKNLLRQVFVFETEFLDSKISVSAMLDYNSKMINYKVMCDWHETGKKGKGIPQLNFYFPLGYKCASYRYDIPFGTIDREPMDMDVPGNSWMLGMAGGDEDKGRKPVMLVTESKYGFRGCGDSMAASLIRSSYDPDPYPEFGIHRFEFAVGLADVTTNDATLNKRLIDRAYNYNHPISIVTNNSHAGTMPLKDSFITLEGGTVAVSSIKMPEEDCSGKKLVLRVYETEGKKTRAVFKLSKKVKAAYFTDINEKVVSSDAEIRAEGEKVFFEAAPYSVVTVCIESE